MRRALGWIGWILFGLMSPVSIGVILISSVDDFPKKVSTVWIDGPGDTRSRGETWVKSSLRDESAVDEYTEVAPDGTETPIGEGPVELDIGGARLYEHGAQAELFVLGSVFRCDHSGRWSAFQAVDASFV